MDLILRHSIHSTLLRGGDLAGSSKQPGYSMLSPSVGSILWHSSSLSMLSHILLLKSMSLLNFCSRCLFSKKQDISTVSQSTLNIYLACSGLLLYYCLCGLIVTLLEESPQVALIFCYKDPNIVLAFQFLNTDMIDIPPLINCYRQTW